MRLNTYQMTAAESRENWTEISFQCSAIHILFSTSDVQPQKNTEGMTLPSNCLETASPSISRVIFLWGELLLTSQLSIYSPVVVSLQQWRMWQGMSWEERIHLDWGDLSRQFAELLSVCLGCNKELFHYEWTWFLCVLSQLGRMGVIKGIYSA